MPTYKQGTQYCKIQLTIRTIRIKDNSTNTKGIRDLSGSRTSWIPFPLRAILIVLDSQVHKLELKKRATKFDRKAPKHRIRC